MGKTIGELHAMLIEYEKGLPKKAETPQGFIEARKLKQGALYLYVGNGVRAQIEAIGSFDIVLPNGLVICLDNCHYAPSITRVSKNNVFYFNVIPSNGIYEIYMHDLVPSVNSIYNVSTKRAKHNLDSTYLWHCHLDHISKKRIEKLQQEGLLKSTDDESFDQCVSCLSEKMTRKSFSHRPERETNLLEIIHTNVCGLLRRVSRQGASYFITFTDDYSRYGYVYLIKHKHDVFETFKVFKNEVENQPEKTIKALRLDRGDDESFDQCVSCLSGKMTRKSFSHRPERETDLLEIIHTNVCGLLRCVSRQGASYFITFTDDYSRYGYVYLIKHKHDVFETFKVFKNEVENQPEKTIKALRLDRGESATRILNMVLTKKVDKTLYELWYGKVPNLSYLKVWGCEALVKRDTPDNLQQRSVKCIFIGYPKEIMGY
nr:hypothetical protein [Tanacetum cinerariifolium]